MQGTVGYHLHGNLCCCLDRKFEQWIKPESILHNTSEGTLYDAQVHFEQNSQRGMTILLFLGETGEKTTNMRFNASRCNSEIAFFLRQGAYATFSTSHTMQTRAP
jgi:hypothetical protein